MNLNFGDAVVDVSDDGDDEDDGNYDEFQDVSEKFDDKCTEWTKEKFIEEICALEGYNDLFEGFEYNKVRNEMKKGENGKPSSSGSVIIST